MNRAEVAEIILQEKLIAILRVNDADTLPVLITGLVAGGIKVLEITSNSPDFAAMIEKNRKRYPDILIGAGTVANRDLAIEAIHAGAQFLVSPNTHAGVISVAHDHDIPVVMGALTPTEVGEAIEQGADIIKLFPAGNFGPRYLKAIKAPFDKVRFFAVGGIHLEDMEKWMEAGADGLGLGSVLTHIDGLKLTEEIVAHNARKYVAKIKQYE
ncbi:bifunctional 4-hydroxy-2-oxoglutarate aldolase/2-dehydro-3-deoxy-phosphogluconate aldolase [Echinicola rosea]|uniref:2-dehydro-3-deoxy-phosphogluconate aldolase n=1 Tax=Echinicola rosea TaxID=1807691 RepID=A0ABQ1USI0_9BACT|nr:bifunctional 4-hydroxy-2-oxoglutarate aldolase/2-dehydro-3-deoxy-phosphogluconate aldolase [Echinicola rosea]GGF26023.1 2-dehydro-3-deoxy-phosphogluconate aldolase [Echinicola rosea]